jgi:hypothetical protein
MVDTRTERGRPKSKGSALRLTDIVVRRSACDCADEYALVLANVNFVNAMLNDGACILAEMPPNAMISYHVDYYFAQVMNGGLSQFVGNSGWKPHIVSDCLTGLEAMGLQTQHRIFRDLKELLESDPERARAIAAGRGFGDIDHRVAELDDEFFAAENTQPITEANANWLMGLPEFEIVPDDKYEQMLEDLKASNPVRQKRLAARRRADVQHVLESRMQAAARLMCWSAWKCPVDRITAGEFDATAPNGQTTVRWRVHTRCGSHSLYLTEGMVFLSDIYLQDGRRYSIEVMEEEQRSWEEEGDLTGDKYLTASEREVARAEMGALEKAIKVAGDLKVATTADLLCNALSPPEKLTNACPIPDDKMHVRSWAVVTEQNIYTLTYSGDGALLDDSDGKRLAEVPYQDIKRLVNADVALDAWGET